MMTVTISGKRVYLESNNNSNNNSNNSNGQAGDEQYYNCSTQFIATQCPFCFRIVTSTGQFRDIHSIKEYYISGLCQTCQDDFFGGEVLK